MGAPHERREVCRESAGEAAPVLASMTGQTVFWLASRVDPFHDGWTLLEYLCHRFRYLPSETWLERIALGRVRVGGRAAAAGTSVAGGDLVEYEVHVVEPPVDFSYTIVHEDDDLVVVSKSGSIPVHAAGKYFRNTLIARLREDIDPELDLAHRLDRETSGLVVLTRNREASRRMAGAFARGEVTKTYLAVVRGLPAADEFVVDAPIGRVGKDFPVARAVVDTQGGKPAKTAFRVLGRLRDVSVLEARPATGRRNQVRVHLEHAGHPIVGDKIYGMPLELLEESLVSPDSSRVREHLVVPRHALHAWRLAFAQPRTGARIALEAPIPKDMADLIESRRSPA
jgi:23S rRNA pseudouridine1911/1915/1917 synthase